MTRSERLIRFLEAEVKDVILPDETLIIFDEIQTYECALTSLKYFCENAPEYHVATAGSLLGVAVNRQRYSFPVGKVESVILYQLDFEEFLWVVGEERLADEIRMCSKYTPMEALVHTKALVLSFLNLLLEKCSSFIVLLHVEFKLS